MCHVQRCNRDSRLRLRSVDIVAGHGGDTIFVVMNGLCLVRCMELGSQCEPLLQHGCAVTTNVESTACIGPNNAGGLTSVKAVRGTLVYVKAGIRVRASSADGVEAWC